MEAGRYVADARPHELQDSVPQLDEARRVQQETLNTEAAKQTEYFKFGGARHSPDHKLEAWSADVRGSEYFSIRIRDWESGADTTDIVEETDGGIVWAADSKSFFYVKLDDNHRPMQVYRHTLGTPQKSGHRPDFMSHPA